MWCRLPCTTATKLVLPFVGIRGCLWPKSRLFSFLANNCHSHLSSLDKKQKNSNYRWTKTMMFFDQYTINLDMQRSSFRSTFAPLVTWPLHWRGSVLNRCWSSCTPMQPIWLTRQCRVSLRPKTKTVGPLFFVWWPMSLEHFSHFELAFARIHPSLRVGFSTNNW